MRRIVRVQPDRIRDLGVVLWSHRPLHEGRYLLYMLNCPPLVGVRIEERSDELPVRRFSCERSRRCNGDVVGQLFTRGEVPIGNVVEMRPADDLSYRLFSSEGVDGIGAGRAVLKAGPAGARFTLRDEYPMIENPRFFR